MADIKTGKTNKKSRLFTKFYQFWYLTVSNFNNNNLWDSACSCSFGFVFSFVPIALIIFSVLISVLKVSPGVIQYIYDFNEQIKNIVDLTPLIENLINKRTIHFADIILGIWIIWMARRLFLSIVRGMNTIFHAHQEKKGLFIQLFTFLSEFVLVIIFITVIMSTFTFNKLFENSLQDNSFFAFFYDSFPNFFQVRSNVIFTSVTYFLLFIFTLYCYHIVSGSKPRFRVCCFYAFCNTATFFILSFLINIFLNIPNYNFVYGTISTLIIMMVKVYFFFVIFLFCAQMVYVSQFFDDLLISELYLLPDQKQKGIWPTLRRKAFINSLVLQTESNTSFYKAGQIIYTYGDSSDKVFYLREGQVMEETDTEIIRHDQGSVFGEIPVLLNQTRTGILTAVTDCVIMDIPAEKFKEIVNENPKVTAQALESIKTHLSTIQQFRVTIV